MIYITNYSQTLINLTSQISLRRCPLLKISLSPMQPNLTSNESRPHSHSLSLPLATPLKPSLLPASPLCYSFLSCKFVFHPFFWVHSPPCLCLSLWPKYPSPLVWFKLVDLMVWVWKLGFWEWRWEWSFVDSWVWMYHLLEMFTFWFGTWGGRCVGMNVFWETLYFDRNFGWTIWFCSSFFYKSTLFDLIFSCPLEHPQQWIYNFSYLAPLSILPTHML